MHLIAGRPVPMAGVTGTDLASGRPLPTTALLHFDHFTDQPALQMLIDGERRMLLRVLTPRPTANFMGMTDALGDALGGEPPPLGDVAGWQRAFEATMLDWFPTGN